MANDMSVPETSDPETLGDAARMVAGHYRRASLSPIFMCRVAATVDLLCFALAFWFGRFALASPAAFAPWQAAGDAALASMAVVTILLSIGAYSVGRLRYRWRAAALALGIGLLPGLGYAAIGGGWHRMLAEGLALASILVPLRLVMARFVQWAVEVGMTERRAVLAGGGRNADSLIRALANSPDNDIRVVGIFDGRDDVRSPPQVLGVPKIGTFAQLVGFSRAAEIDMIIVTLPLEAEERIATLLHQLRVLPQPVHLAALRRDIGFRSRNEGGLLISALPGSYLPDRRLTKRLFDLAVGSIALILVFPIMAAAALAIALDSPGPVFFRQKRHGFNNRVIDVLKFRTMHHDLSDPRAVNVVTRGDPRVTRVGRWLRKSSIDELPQLFNVLGGGLSLVGPRPHAIAAQSSRQERFAEIVDGYSARHRLPPGITGYAQIMGWRGEVDDPDKLRQRVSHDLYYIQHWSIWFDVWILLRTPISLMDTRNAY